MASDSIASNTTTEANSFGTNDELLSRMSQISGATYPISEDFTLFQHPTVVRKTDEYWPWFVAAGAVLYWLGIGIQKLHQFGFWRRNES